MEGHWIIEIPLLVECNMNYLCYTTINVSTDYDIRKCRVSDRLSDSFGLLDSNQISNSLRNTQVNHIIDNNGEFNDTKLQISSIIEEYINS